MSPCDDVVDFAAGELSSERADAFRAHLRACGACKAELLEVVELMARLRATESGRWA